MTALNSTNGTYRNGIRVEPSETVSIEVGDEVRLGKLEFEYR
jgi:pSer/pThr/pTyr-binding forkhead associated (FHA) protein